MKVKIVAVEIVLMIVLLTGCHTYNYQGNKSEPVTKTEDTVKQEQGKLGTKPDIEEKQSKGKEVQEESKRMNENIQMVKSGHDKAFPNLSYGEAFEAFFEKPQWRSFIGVIDDFEKSAFARELNSKEDILNNPFSITIVEFEGDFFYQAKRVKATIQFNLDKEAGIFLAQYLALDDKEQDRATLVALLSKVFAYKKGKPELTAEDIEKAKNLMFQEDEALDRKMEEERQKVQEKLAELEVDYDGFWQAINQNGFMNIKSGVDSFGNIGYEVEIIIYKNENAYDQWLLTGLQDNTPRTENSIPISDFMGVKSKYINGVKIEEEILNDLGVNTQGTIYYDEINKVVVVKESYSNAEEIIFERPQN